MSESMVERVAWAIQNEVMGLEIGPPRAPEKRFVRAACSAIAAMRDPPYASRVEAWGHRWDTSMPGGLADWHRMIDAILTAPVSPGSHSPVPDPHQASDTPT
jgi:hypothetical protein